MNEDIIQRLFDVERELRRLKAQIQGLVMPMQQTETTAETATPTVQFTYPGGSTSSVTPIHQQFGFWSRPLAGSYHTVVSVGGMPSNAISIGSNDERHRPLSLGEGDSYMGDSNAQSIWLKNGTIVIHTAGTLDIQSGGTLTITAPTLNINANVAITGTLTDNSHDVGSTHKHTNTQSGGGVSGVPQ